jgi:hypothetical protein
MLKAPNKYHLKEFYFEELKGLIEEEFRNVWIFESILESEFELGRQLKQERARRGHVGITVGDRETILVGSMQVDVRSLHNTHSFAVLASGRRGEE